MGVGLGLSVSSGDKLMETEYFGDQLPDNLQVQLQTCNNLLFYSAFHRFKPNISGFLFVIQIEDTRHCNGQYPIRADTALTKRLIT